MPSRMDCAANSRLNRISERRMVEGPRNSAETWDGSGSGGGAEPSTTVVVAIVLRRQRTWMNGQTSASIMVQNSTRGMLIYSKMSFGLSRDTHCSITGLAAANSATKTVLITAGISQSAMPG